MTKKNRTGLSANVFVRILKKIIMFLGFALIGAVVLTALYSVIVTCRTAKITEEFLVFYIFIVQLAQLLFGISLTTKVLYFSSDGDLLKLPVNGSMILLSKIFYLYIKELLFSLFLGLPVFIEFGILTGQGAGFYGMLIIICLLFPLLPFLFSLILSVPAMYLVSFLKNKFLVMLFMYIVLVAGGFFVYITGLKFILTVLQSNDAASVFSGNIVVGIKTVASYLYIPLLYKNILVGYRVLPCLFIITTICLILGGIIYLFASKTYLKILLKNAENNNHSFTKKYIVKDRSITKALFFKEFLGIFRSVNYSFQYLTIAITTPLMVYFSDSVVSNIGIEAIGNGVLPGVSILVLIMFLTMGTSFAATSITREGGNFFHTKIIPVSYTKQIFVKFMLYILVAIPSILISCVVLALFKFLTITESLLIGLGVILIIVGNIASSISMDINKPQFMYLDGKEVTSSTKNVNTTIGVGFLIAAIMGVGGIVAAIVLNVSTLYMVLFGFSVPYVIIEVFLLFFRLEKKYRGIEA